MSQGTRKKKDCEARLRALVPADETIVAVGTAEELRNLVPTSAPEAVGRL